MNADTKLDVVPSPEFVDWPSIYRSVDEKLSHPFPNRAFEGTVGPSSITRALYVELEKSPLPLGAVARKVYADVIRLPKGTIALSNQMLVLHARRIEAPDPCTIVLNLDEPGTLLRMGCSEFVGEIRVTGVNLNSDRPSVSFNVDSLSSEAFGFTVTSNASLRTDEGPLGEERKAGSQLEASLETIFAYASMLAMDNPKLAAAQCDWITKCCVGISDYSVLFAQAASLGNLCRSRVAGTWPVPKVMPSAILENAGEYVNAAKTFEGRYFDLSNDALALGSRKQAAQLLGERQRGFESYERLLVDQGQAELESRKEGLGRVNRRFQAQQQVVDSAAISFEFGLTRARWEQLEQGVFKLFKNTVGFIQNLAGFIGTAAVGVPNAAAGAKTAEKLAQAGKTLKDGITLIQGLSPLLASSEATLGAINMQVAGVASSESLVASVLAEAGADDSGDYASAVKDLQAQLDVVGAMEIRTAWLNFANNARISLSSAIESKITGAAEYLSAIDTLALYGIDVNNALLAVSESQQTLLRTQMRMALTQHDGELIEGLVNKLDEDGQAVQEVAQRYDRQYQAIKRTILLMLEQYKLAYGYATGRPSTINPTITDDVGGLQLALASASSELLNSGNLTAQPLDGVSVDFNDDELLSRIRAGQDDVVDVTLSIDLDAPEFRGFGHIRLRKIQVLLCGVSCSKGAKMNVNVSPGGSYRDRPVLGGSPVLDGDAPVYVGPAFRMRQQYDPARDSFPVSIAIADENQGIVFEPTPFTNWDLSIERHDSNGKLLGFSGLSSVRMTFFGSVVAV